MKETEVTTYTQEVFNPQVQDLNDSILEWFHQNISFSLIKAEIGSDSLTIHTQKDRWANRIQFKDAALKPVQDAIERNREALTTLGTIIKDFVIPLILNGFGDALRFLGKIAGGILDVIGAVVNGIKSAVSFAIDSINALIRAYNAIPILPNVSTISKPSFTTSSPSTSVPSLPSTPKITTPSVPSTATTPTTPKVTTPTTTATTPVVTTTIVPSGKAIPSGFDVAAVRAGEEKGNVVINVNAPSVIDDTYNGIKVGKLMIEELGYTKH